MFLEVLGVGFFGEVRKGLYAPAGDDQQPVIVAIKQLKAGWGCWTELRSEIQALQKVREHPNVVKFLGAIMTGKGVNCFKAHPEFR